MNSDTTAAPSGSDTTTAPSPNEISKKELLAQTGISYGQLYRWKREGLIPEEWFEKRSAFTGQETFFPRELILTRVKAIQSMKDDLSHSEIRERLAQMPELFDPRKMLLAVSDMSEDCIDSLGISWEEINLTETSIKAVATLYSALEETEAGEKATHNLIARVINTLTIKTSDAQAKEAAPLEEG